MLNLLFLPLALTGLGVKISLLLQNNNEEIRLQEEGEIWSTIESELKIKDVSLREETSGMIVTDSFGKDHLYMWGENTKGQLGLGYKSDYETLPKEVKYELSKDYKLNNLEIGGDHVLLGVTNSNIKDHLYTWGYNTSGQQEII